MEHHAGVLQQRVQVAAIRRRRKQPVEGVRSQQQKEQEADGDEAHHAQYPRDHLVSYDIRKRQRRDLGRIGSVNAQALFIDRRHRVWTTSDYGRLVRYDPAKDRMETSPYVLPHNPQFQTGWHSVFYDACGSPDGQAVYAVTWIANP